jgi:hypothetical protein
MEVQWSTRRIFIFIYFLKIVGLLANMESLLVEDYSSMSKMLLR